ncbi:MAG TPA: transcriptional regulator [Flavobacteriales bacterium]|nr:transcriptional regulator [Flavobacteriales bacterium]
MKNIQMVDLHSQYLRIKDEVNQGMNEVLESSAFIGGPAVSKFSSELASYLKVKHVIPCANGTDALQIALMALGLKPGDEVITADFTFAATVEVIALLGLEPILVDVEASSYNIDPVALRKAITPKTKAIIPVHLFGQCAPMDEVLEIAKEFNLFVVEDTAQAIGAQYSHKDGSVSRAGTMGHFGTTSFFPSKNLGCYGDGGALFTNDDALADKARVVANHGMKVRYYHDEIGVNSRLDSLQAVVLGAKLKHLDSYVKARQSAADYYDKAFSNCEFLEIPSRVSYSNHVFHQYTLKTRGIDHFELQKYLMDKGVPAMIYYPVALHSQKAYTRPEYKEENFPVTNELCKSVISLPMHTELDLEQLEFITQAVLSYR